MKDKVVKIVEVGPRDGLQNEMQTLPVSVRVELINRLNTCGFQEIEVGSFVSPRWIPQLIHTDQVCNQITKKQGIRYIALVPNERGLQDALRVGIKDIAVFTAASETFNQKNINCSIQESFDRFQPVMEVAKKEGIRVRGYVSCVIECPYEGMVKPEAVQKVAAKLWQMGCAEISLGDTIGSGIPTTIQAMVEACKQEIPVSNLALHCHDTYGNAIVNILAALDQGITVVDAAIAGLGGCPYAKIAKGNVASEDVVDALESRGIKTGIHQNKLLETALFINDYLQREPTSTVMQNLSKK